MEWAETLGERASGREAAELKWGGFRALVSTEDELRPKPTRMEHETKPGSASQGLMLPELHPGGRRFESA